jgi:hypothetical protein
MPLMRKYSANDREACLKIFDSNVPVVDFSASERIQYEGFLDHLPGPYFVVEDDKEIVACGGYAPHKSEVGAITFCWGLVTQKRHKSGLGRFLLTERLKLVSTDALFVVVNTSQHSYGFFAKMGFKTDRVVQDGLNPGIDLHEMRFSLRA